jgi:hypothetical protein
MADVSLNWNSDFQVSATGDLVTVDGALLTQQRIIRRICTAVRGYIFNLPYGAGLPQKIGGTWQVSTIKAIIMSQIAMESSVAPSPPPIINVSANPNDLATQTIFISYTDSVTGETTSFSFTA